MAFLTIFTPTFNRAHTMPRVYESLLNQTDRDFEWLIIDDGSTDGTEALADRWIAEAPFGIRYLRQPNAGKHIAWNRALELAGGDYFMCLDSDDALAANAVASLKADLKPKLGTPNEVPARAFLLMDQDGRPYGKDFSSSDLSKSFADLHFEGKMPSDVWIVFQRDKIRDFPFPERYRNVYFPERFVIAAFSQRHPIRFLNNVRLGYYYRDPNDCASNSARATYSKLRSGAALTLSMMHLANLNYHMKYFWTHPLRLIKNAIYYVRFRLRTDDWNEHFIREIDSRSGRLLALLSIVPGICLHLLDTVRLKSLE